MAILHVKSPNEAQTNVDLSKLVMTDTAQSITGTKTFTNIELSDGASIRHYDYSHSTEQFELPQTIIGYMGEYPGTELAAWESRGAKIALHNSDDDGGFIIRASDGTTYCDLVGNPNGILQWQDHNVEVVTSSNANNNSSGYIAYKSGLKIQWGWGDFYNDQFIYFPINFTTAWSVVIADGASWVGDTSNNGFYYHRDSNLGPVNDHWIAIGI